MKTFIFRMSALDTYKDIPIGQNKVLRNLWEQRPVLLVFLRRLGCAICRAYVQELKEHMEEITLYADVAFLSFEERGTGSDEDRSFETVWSGPLYVIPKRVYKDLFGKKKFFDGLFGLADMNTSLVKKHNTRGNLQGDGFVLGGQFLVSSEGILLERRQKFYGDDLPVEIILKTLRGLKN